MNKAPPMLKTQLEKSLIETGFFFYSIYCMVMQGFKIDGFPCHTCPLMIFSAWCYLPSLSLASRMLPSYVINPTLIHIFSQQLMLSIFSEFLREALSPATTASFSAYRLVLVWRWKSTKSPTQKRFQSLKARKQPGIILLAGIYLGSLSCVLFLY